MEMFGRSGEKNPFCMDTPVLSGCELLAGKNLAVFDSCHYFSLKLHFTCFTLCVLWLLPLRCHHESCSCAASSQEKSHWITLPGELALPGSHSLGCSVWWQSHLAAELCLSHQSSPMQPHQPASLVSVWHCEGLCQRSECKIGQCFV